MAKNILKRIFEAGRRNSAVDQARIQEAHDHMVGLGAQCEAAKETKEALREAEALRVDDSFSSRIEALRKAARMLLCDRMRVSEYDCYCYVRDCFDSDVIVQCGDAIYQIPYTVGADGDDVTLGEPMEVDVAYIPATDPEEQEKETAGDEIVESQEISGSLRSRLAERDIPQSARKKMDAKDFAGKGKSFPITEPEDVAAALKSIGRAGSGNYPADKLKSRILAIAKRKGFPIPKSDQKEMDSEKVTESASIELAGEFVDLREAAIGADGTGAIKIIQPGWGSSGYYSPEVLKRDGPKVFTKGLKMYWDHQTEAEEAARPEGSLDDLASELSGNAYWDQNGPKGAALYAPIKAFEAYTPAINDLSKSIGVSIRAAGRASQGKAEGKEGPIIQSLESAKSIDFVTSPGAGGEILQLFEAARRTPKKTPTDQESLMEAKDLKEANAKIAALESEQIKLRETVLLAEAARFVNNELTGVQLPGVTKQRLMRELISAMPLKENALDTAAYKAHCETAVKEAVAEIVAITGAGEVKGMGSAPTADDVKAIEESAKSLEASFATLGLSESAAKLAAKGRN